MKHFIWLFRSKIPLHLLASTDTDLNLSHFYKQIFYILKSKCLKKPWIRCGFDCFFHIPFVTGWDVDCGSTGVKCGYNVRLHGIANHCSDLNVGPKNFAIGGGVFLTHDVHIFEEIPQPDCANFCSWCKRSLLVIKTK